VWQNATETPRLTMTAPAKKLTKGANLSSGGGAGTFTDPNHTARVFLDALGRLGYDKRALLAAAGVDFSNSDDPDARVPCQAIGGMFGYAMRTRPLKNLGMKLAAETPVGAFPLLDYLIVTCETVSHGISQLSRYFRLNDAPYELEIRSDEDPVRIVFHGPRDSLTFEFGVSLVVLHLREETENRLVAAHASFTHRPGDVDEMQRVLGCPVCGGESWNGFALSRDSWQLPMRRRDPVLRGVLERHAEEVIARLPAGDDMTLEIRRAIMLRIPQGEIEIQSVARSLATSARSLQRRLSAAGTSYQELLDSTRREAASRYLLDRSLSIGEIAYLLGYSEPPAFHRAFKRWNGITPHEFRHQRAEESALSAPPNN
jgi:AraC-like DNA-binding protein